MKAKNHDEWRQIVLRRDNHTCVNCGTQTNLVVDHIEPQQLHPELALETDNGRVLCNYCHSRIGKKTHRSRSENQILYINPILQDKTLHSRLYWPKKLRSDGYGEEVNVQEGAYCIVIPKPGASSKDVAHSLKLIYKYFAFKAKDEQNSLSQQFEHKAEITERE